MRTVTVLLPSTAMPATRGTVYMLRHNADQMPVRIVSCDPDCQAVGRYLADRFATSPHQTNPDYASFLLDYCEREQVQVVIPANEWDALTLSRHREAFLSRGIQPLVAEQSVVCRACDKELLLRAFVEMGFQVPDHEVISSVSELEAAAERLGYPERKLVVKPAALWGARGFRILTEEPVDPEIFFSERPAVTEIALADLSSVMRRAEKIPRLMLMEYLPGREYSVDAFRGRGGAYAVPRWDREIVGAVASETVLEQRHDLTEMTLRLAEHIDLRFVFGMQYKFNGEGVPMVLECNPRVQGTCVASLFGGANLVWMAVCEALGMPIPKVPEEIQEATFCRHWTGTAYGTSWHAEI